MSRKSGDVSKSPTREHYTVSGRILGGAGVASIIGGEGFSLTYGGAGVYQVTTDVNFPKLRGAGAIAMSTIGSHRQYQIAVKAYVEGGAGTSVTFEVANAGVPTDLGAADELWFDLNVSRTVKP